MSYWKKKLDGYERISVIKKGKKRRLDGEDENGKQ